MRIMAYRALLSALLALAALGTEMQAQQRENRRTDSIPDRGRGSVSDRGRNSIPDRDGGSISDRNRDPKRGFDAAEWHRLRRGQQASFRDGRRELAPRPFSPFGAGFRNDNRRDAVPGPYPLRHRFDGRFRDVQEGRLPFGHGVDVLPPDPWQYAPANAYYRRDLMASCAVVDFETADGVSYQVDLLLPLLGARTPRELELRLDQLLSRQTDVVLPGLAGGTLRIRGRTELTALAVYGCQ